MLLKIVYLLTGRVLGLAVLVFRGGRAKDAELLVLRHENAVLRGHIGRVRYEPADRVWLAAPRPAPRRDQHPAAGAARRRAAHHLHPPTITVIALSRQLIAGGLGHRRGKGAADRSYST